MPFDALLVEITTVEFEKSDDFLKMNQKRDSDAMSFAAHDPFFTVVA